MRQYKPDMRPEKIILGKHTLTIAPDGYYRDEYGIRYDVRENALYRESQPGMWTEIRRGSTPAIVGADGKELW